MIFESHAHYDDEAFDTDRQEILQGMQEHGIKYIVNTGAGMASSKRSIELAQEFPDVYAAIGVHPEETGEMTAEDLNWLRQQCSTSKVVAVGEIGLDYHWPEPARDIQKLWFGRQLQMAYEENMPVIIHSREAAKDTLEIMQNIPSKQSGRKGSIHCFSYSEEVAKIFLKMGYDIGIGGVITFKNAKKLKEAVKSIPLERILLETDSPYLAPEPYRGSRNCSYYLPLVAQAIAEIKGVTAEKVIEITQQNAMELFGINTACSQSPE